MPTVATSPLLSLSLSLSASRSSTPCSQSPSSPSCTFSACPSRPPCLPLSAHFLNICMYPPAVCLYPLIFSPLSLSAQREHADRWSHGAHLTTANHHCLLLFRCLCISSTLSPYIIPLFAHILSPLSVSVAVTCTLSALTQRS